MIRVLIDTNIILDIALARLPFYNDSVNVLKKLGNKSIQGFVTATTITDIYYIAKKDKGHTIAIEFIANLIQIIDVIGIGKEIIIESLTSKINDFEDAIQSVASDYNSIDYIITRNTKDYKNSKVAAISPSKFVNLTKRNE